MRALPALVIGGWIAFAGSGCVALDDDAAENPRFGANGGGPDRSTGGMANTPTGGRSTGGMANTQTAGRSTGGVSGTPSGGRGSGGTSSGGTPSSANDVADEYVRAHNEVRAAVEEPPDYPGSWQPLPPVTWSEAVAATAEQWAQHLADTNDCDLEHASGTGYGENLAGSSGPLSPARAVELWASEKSEYMFEPAYRFESNTGHYTQLVWRDSVQIGCGSARCGSATVVCCRYSPAGNFIGRQPY